MKYTGYQLKLLQETFAVLRAGVQAQPLEPVESEVAEALAQASDRLATAKASSPKTTNRAKSKSEPGKSKAEHASLPERAMAKRRAMQAAASQQPEPPKMAKQVESVAEVPAERGIGARLANIASSVKARFVGRSEAAANDDAPPAVPEQVVETAPVPQWMRGNANAFFAELPWQQATATALAESSSVAQAEPESGKRVATSVSGIPESLAGQTAANAFAALPWNQALASAEEDTRGTAAKPTAVVIPRTTSSIPNALQHRAAAAFFASAPWNQAGQTSQAPRSYPAVGAAVFFGGMDWSGADPVPTLATAETDDDFDLDGVNFARLATQSALDLARVQAAEKQPLSKQG